MTIEKNYFSDLAKLDVSAYVEKKNQFSYLSWAHAIDQLKRYDQDADWNVHEFPHPQLPPGAEVPYLYTPKGTLVKVSVTVKGRTHTQWQAVMDHRNQAIMDPDVTQVNKAIQRCLVKAIALHGLGLYIYAGEDLPNQNITQKQIDFIYSLAEDFGQMCNRTKDDVLNALKVGSVVHLNEDHANLVITQLKEWISKKAAEIEAKKATAQLPKEETKGEVAQVFAEEEKAEVVNA